MASILVSEAEPDVRRLLVVLLERLGHDAVVLRPDVVAPPRGDLLLVDPSTPSGVEHARLVRAFFPLLPIVCLAQLPPGAGFLGRGPTSFLARPFTAERLEQALRPAASPV